MSSPPTIGQLQTGGASLVYQTVGYHTISATGPATVPFIFQHGMGGDANQPLSYIGDAAPTPVISLNARGHSPSTDIDPATASFEVFADDVIALADHLRLARFIIGGISLGAGTALNLSIRYPDRVTALVLCRPAWIDRPQIPLPRLVEAELHSDAGLHGAAIALPITNLAWLAKSSAEVYREEPETVTIVYEDDTVVEVRALTRTSLILTEAGDLRRLRPPPADLHGVGRPWGLTAQAFKQQVSKQQRST
jgi:pimeloyl-ACP methyl ester carboxylesterase